MKVLLKIHFIILATLFITRPTFAKPACAVCTPPAAPTYILGIPENIFYILLFSILFLVFLYNFLFKHKNKKQNSSSSIIEKKNEIEKLFQLKEKGIITEKQFQEKKSEILQK